jgi:hypothetical protein
MLTDESIGGRAMWPVKIETVNGHVTATVFGAPELSVQSVDREQAMQELFLQIQKRSALGEIAWIRVNDGPTTRDQPFDIGAAYDAECFGDTAEEFIAAIYRIRDKQKAWEMKAMDL